MIVPKGHTHEYLCVASLKNLMYMICELLSTFVKDHWMLHSVYRILFLIYAHFSMEPVEA